MFWILMTKKQIPFRLHEKDIEKFKQKIVIDKVNMQRVFETLIKMYLEDNEEIMKRIKSVSKDKKHASRRRYNSFDELETEAIFRKISEVSPLAEMERMMEEIERENK